MAFVSVKNRFYYTTNSIMNILLLGSGGRESALAWKIKTARGSKKLFIAPGNAGTAYYGTNVDIQVNDFQAIKDFSLKNKIQMVIVGPEEPLVRGLLRTSLPSSASNSECEAVLCGPRSSIGLVKPYPKKCPHKRLTIILSR